MPMTLQERIAVWKPEIKYEKQKNGESLVIFRDLDGQSHRFTTQDIEEAHSKFLEYVAALRSAIGEGNH